MYQRSSEAIKEFKNLTNFDLAAHLLTSFKMNFADIINLLVLSHILAANS